MNWLKDIFGNQNQTDDFGELFNFVQSIASARGNDYAKYITGYAGLLGRVAYADTVISTKELDKIREILLKESHLNTEDTTAIIDLITTHKVQILTIEEHFYTRMVNDIYTKEQKLNLIKSMFKIAAADGTICSDEENLISRTAQSLNISRPELIKIKRTYAKYLGTLK